jgi:sortase A
MASSSSERPHRTWWLPAAERLAWIVGIVAVSCWIGVTVSGRLGARRELNRFAALQPSSPTPVTGEPDRSTWSPERVHAWRVSFSREAPAPLAVLRVPRLGIEVAVLTGTDEWTLNRAVGHIEDTAAPDSDGNIGIAGHRDGFFRPLKDVHVGDVLELETLRRRDTYQVDRMWIVQPEDVSVLDPTPVAAVTLVTCYPFYFVGSAPQRFIVRAVRTGTKLRGANP